MACDERRDIMTKKNFQDKNAKIFVAGHRGLIGSAIVRELKRKGYTNLSLRTRAELDLRNANDVETFFEQEKPDFVFVAAAKVGGIKANMEYPAEFIYDNIQLQNNVIHSSWKNNVSKLLFLGSSCIYPAKAPQPLKEEYFMTGKFEPTNQAYAVAKTAGIEMCASYRKQYGCDFISVIPTNLYGPGEHFDAQNSHLVAALITKFHSAKMNGDKEVMLWGTGTPLREYMFVDDCAEACVMLMEKYSSSDVINIGIGEDKTVSEIAEVVKRVVGYNGNLVFDATKPDGMHRKLMDVTKINSLGWHAKTNLEDGVRKTYQWYLENIANK